MANDSTYWLTFELLVRDFFRYSAVKYGNSIFHLGGSRRDPGRQAWRTDPGFLEAWKAGETGYPFIDANMRELKASGFMSNRFVEVPFLLLFGECFFTLLCHRRGADSVDPKMCLCAVCKEDGSSSTGARCSP